MEIFFKTPDQAELLQEQTAAAPNRYRVKRDQDYGGKYTGQIGTKVAAFQEAVVLKMDDGREACFHWMDIE